MTKVVIKDSRTTYKSLYGTGVGKYFTLGGSLCCKISNSPENNVFCIKEGQVVSLSRDTQVLPVNNFEISIKG